MPFETQYPYLALANSNLMNAEPCRLKSFSGLLKPQDYTVAPVSLAKEGFYYTGHDVLFKCFSCGLQVDGEEHRGQLAHPRALHRQRSPACALVTDVPRGPCNIPLPVYSSRGSRAIKAVKAFLERSAVPNAGSMTESDNDVHNRALDLRIRRRQSAETPLQFPSFCSPLKRAHSFCGFPPVPGVPTGDFAQAGFFFSGVDDTVICHCCGLSLRDWELGDDPRIAHARLKPACEYFRCHVSPGFIRDAQQELQTIGM